MTTSKLLLTMFLLASANNARVANKCHSENSIHVFGESCDLMCHCKNNEQCHAASGECDSGCATDWFGPGCQYRNLAAEGSFQQPGNTQQRAGRNLAFKRKASQISVHEACDIKQCSAEKAVDGDDNDYWANCSFTRYSNNPWWQMDLGFNARINTIKIVTKNKRGSYYALEVSNITKSSWMANYSVSVDASFDLDVIGRFIKVTGTGRYVALMLCEIYVYGDCVEDICGYDCTRTCHCRKPTLVDKITGNCPNGCKEGWSGSQCNIKAEVQNSCQKGWYGKTCSKQCSSNCYGNQYGVCDKEDGECLGGCKAGWTGINCDQNCADGSYGRNCRDTCSTKCKGGRKNCNTTTGYCTNGCKSGWTGQRCDEECAAGYYGDGCNNKCSVRCEGGYQFCNHRNGHCLRGCKPGWNGDRCDKVCTDGTYGQNCSLTCNENCKTQHGETTCDASNGRCSHGCKAGWRHDFCDEECWTGWYGDKCATRCNQQCLNEMCKHTDGSCTNGCKPGWRGLTCEDQCERGWYGDKCKTRCNQQCLHEICKHTDGSCTNGCKPGWRGHTCEEECTAGNYGTECSSNCSSKCKHETCDHVDGECQDGCKPGYLGFNCSQNCTTRTFGEKCERNCSDHCRGGYKMCRNIDGHCLKGCQTGWNGERCNSKCQSGIYGEGCNSTCPSNCKNDVCDYVNGTCTEGCKPGYQGNICKNKCKLTKYGEGCKNSCPPNCKNGICDYVNGSCKEGCKTGYQGNMCENKCDDGFYGETCSSVCGHCKSATGCNHVTGTCYGGCESGYTGDICLQLTQTPESLNAAVAGGLVALLVIIILVFIVVILVKRRGKKKRNGEQNGNIELKHPNKRTNFENRRMSNGSNMHLNQAGESSTEYMNMYNNSDVPEQKKNPIPLSNLLSYVKQCLTNPSHFADEFTEIPYGMQKSSAVAKQSYNSGKNRYKNMHAYDHSRVVLKTLSEERGSNYINANFIKGHHKENAYIAAQGPIVTSVDDFWRMIWEKDVYTIAMVTNLVEDTKNKCLQYWPPVETKIRYGYILVSTESEINFADFTIRNFKVSFERENSHRDIRQFHFTAWPDKGVPLSTSSLLQFWRKVRRTDETKDHTWLVHCSAGVGMTGTFIATDILYDQGKERGYIDVYQCVKDLRDQRVNMVQTKEQYVYLHTLMVEALVLPSEPVPLDNLHNTVRDLKTVDPTTRKTRLVLQYETLNEDWASFHTDVEMGEMFSTALLDENKNKNRFNTILPPNRFRPFLVTNIPGCTNYINAVHMPSYSHKPGYIITQKPLDNTVIDYCRLIYELNVKVIVMFPDKDCVAADITVGPFMLTKVSEEDKLFYIKRMFNFVYNTEERKVVQLEFKNWNGIQITPCDPANMLCFLQEVEFLYRVESDSPVLVQCFDGSEKSGLFVVLMNILEHARFDDEVSIPQVIRQLRHIRQQIIPNFEQFQFCYDAVLCYIDNNQMYTNM